MVKDNITLRQKKILQEICNEDKYITISNIAEKLGISSRTVLRELSGVEKWLLTYHCTLDKKSGLGIRLSGTCENKKAVIERLEEHTEASGFTPAERQLIIISELLQDKEPVKIFSFTKRLKVTEGTVSHDLDKVEEWLKDYDLKLVRKPGLGIYVEGPERTVRQAIVNLIYENVNESQLLNLVKSSKALEDKTRDRLLNLIEKDTIKKIETLIFELEKKLRYRLADNAYIGLLIHLTLAIQRIRKNEKIVIDPKYLSELKTYNEFEIAQDLTKQISQVFNIEIPEDETGYITMHLIGSKSFDSLPVSSEKKDTNELQELASEMIKIVEAETGYLLEYNESLFDGLISHLGPAINRLKMNMDIRNPLLQEIKEHYSSLFILASKCVGVVEEKIGIKMPDSEIAYIAMHLGAALENSKTKVKRIFRVAISCTTGIGTSRLLATRIKKEYENIQIIEIISTLHVKEEWLKENGIDFIISTVNLDNSSVPVIVVNPLLFEKDKAKINVVIRDLMSSTGNYTNKAVKQLNLKDKLSNIRTSIDGMVQVLNNFFVDEYEQLDSIEKLIEKIGGKIGNSEESKELIKKSLIFREEKGSTILTGYDAMLLHCRTSGVKELYFGVVKVKEGIVCTNSEGQKELINLAIIMLAPEKCDRGLIEVLSFISETLILEEDFIGRLKKDTWEELYYMMNSLMDKFYRRKTIEEK
jgi:mannitol operon transcriptional antiterminator